MGRVAVLQTEKLPHALMARPGFLVQQLENKVLQSRVRKNRVFHSLHFLLQSCRVGGATMHLMRPTFLWEFNFFVSQKLCLEPRPSQAGPRVQ